MKVNDSSPTSSSAVRIFARIKLLGKIGTEQAEPFSALEITLC